MIRVHCAGCGKELRVNGALLFGPPDADDQSKKTHLCVGCYKDTIYWLDVTLPAERENRKLARASRRHSRNPALRCPLCAPLRCKKAP